MSWKDGPNTSVDTNLINRAMKKTCHLIFKLNIVHTKTMLIILIF